VIAEHGIDVALQYVPQSRNDLQGWDKIAVCPPAEIPGENAKIVFETAG
jgi:hypothetical protein